MPPWRPESAADYRENLLESLFNTMLNFRLDEIRRQPEAPFTSAFVGGGNLVRPVDIYSVGAQLLDDRILDGIDVVMTEVARVQQYGFTPSELERAKAQVLQNYESLYRDRENTDSVSFAEEYVRHFLTGESIPGIEVEYAGAEELPAITVDDVNAVTEKLVGNDNRTLRHRFRAGKRDAAHRGRVTAVLDGVAAKELELYPGHGCGRRVAGPRAAAGGHRR
ncbi:MAG: insulinase family protein [Caldilineaceae bacterium]